MVDTPQFDDSSPVEPLNAAPQFDDSSPVEPLQNQQQAPHDFSWGQMATDIWPEIKKEAGTAVQGITNLSKRGEQGPVEGMLNTANAALSVPRLIASPVTGAIKSIGGHGMANLEHAVGTLIAPETAAKDNPEAMYETAKSDVDRAMVAARPAGSPIKAPNLFGTKGYEWTPPPKSVPTTSTTPEVVSAAQRASEASGVPINVPRAFASDNVATQRMGQLAKNVPLVGDSIPRATGEMVDQMGNAIGSIASHYGEGSGPNVASRIANTISGAAEAEKNTAGTAARLSDEALLADWQRAQDEALHQVGQQETEAENIARNSNEALLADWQRAQDEALHQVGQHENTALTEARTATGDMSPQEMGQALIGRLRTEETAARANKNALYTTAGEQEASVTAKAVRGVRGLISDTLNEAGRTDPKTGKVDPQLLPASTAMMDEIENFSSTGRPTRDPATGRMVAGSPATAKEMEQTRKRLVNLSGTAGNDSDIAAAKIIKDMFDEWQGHAYDNALFSGSPEALQAFRDARAANTSWRQRFYNDRDDADKLINKVVTGEVTPQEMSNWIVGSGQVGAKGTSLRMLTRLQEATAGDPEVMNTVRAGVANRLFGTTEGATARAPEKIASDIYEFFNGTGSAVANRLFTPQQRQTALNYANALRRGQEARQDIASTAKLTKPTPMEAGPMREARQNIAEAGKLTKPTPQEVGPGPMQELATAILGKSGKTDEALFAAIDAYAKSGGRGDIKSLADIIRNIPEKDKGDLAGAIIRKLGYSDQAKGFSPEKFATEWAKYTPQAKAVLFGNSGPHRQALDDIALIAQRYKEVGRRFGNPSGTAQNVVGFGSLAAVWTHPFTAIPALIGGAVFSKMLSAPATAQKTAGLFRTAWEMTKNPTPGNMARLTYAGSIFARSAEKAGSNLTVPQFLQQLQLQLSGPGISRADQQPADFNERFNTKPAGQPYKGPNLGPIQGHAQGGSVKKNNIKGYAEGGNAGDDYNTVLSPEEEQKYQHWKSLNAPDDSGVDYDLRGAYTADMQRSPDNGHMGDRFKKPNHPTFSDQSQYAIGDQRQRAGTWAGPEGPDQTFVPPTPYGRGGRARGYADGGDPTAADLASQAEDQLYPRLNSLPPPTDNKAIDEALLPDVGPPAMSWGQGTFSQGNPAVNATINKLTTDQPGQPRYQTWPEKVLRSGATLAGDVMSGQEPVMDPETGHVSEHAIERAQDMAALAGSGGLGAGAEDAGAATLGSGPFLRPALKHEGKIYKAPIKDPDQPLFFGAEHSDALPPHLQQDFYEKAMNGQDINDYKFGFMNHKGQFLEREPALDYGVKEGLVDPYNARYGTLTSTMLSDTQKPGAALSALEHQPFYSAVEKTVQSAPQSKMHGEQWANWIKNQPGVKPDELQYTGVNNWLRTQKGPVTKQQVQDYIADNKVQVNDVVKGGHKNWTLDDSVRLDELERNRHNLSDEEEAEFQNLVDRENNNSEPGGSPEITKYSSYQLPGGENYREHLLTLPKKLDRDNVNPSDTASAKYMDQWNALVKERQVLQDKVNDYNRNLSEPEWKKAMADFETINKKMDDLHYKMVDDTMAENPAKYGDNYKSSHWGEPNILAHVRINDRVMQDQAPQYKLRNKISGNTTKAFDSEQEALAHRETLPEKLRPNLEPVKVGDTKSVPTMHIEELQSDMHQQGRKQGYKGQDDLEKFNQIDKQLSNARNDLAEESNRTAQEKLGSSWQKFRNENPDRETRDKALNDLYQHRLNDPKFKEAESKVRDLEQQLSLVNPVNKIPDAPFKTSWPEMAMKRMIAKAVEEGKSRISWTPGEAQAARYNLSKQISKIAYNKDEHTLQAFDHNNNLVINNRTPPDKLSDTIGKEAADKLLNNPTKIHKDRYGNWNHLEGVDLKVGGEGMKGFYDQMMPKMVEKLGKPYGVKVHMNAGKIGRTLEEELRNRGLSQKSFNELSLSQRNKILEKVDAGKPVHYFDIPKAMAEKVKKEGFPLFSDTNIGMVGQADSDNKKNIPRPEQEKERERASGGRVVASNINHEPSEAQKKAGNYAKDHVYVHGLDITIENAKGSTRSGKDKDGKEWKTTLPSHYGYLKRSEGNDGDHLDIYLGPHIRSDKVYVVNQVNADTGKFDEHKIMIGFRNLHHALETYEKAFSDGKGLQRVGSIVPTDIKQLKEWLKTDTTKPYIPNQTGVGSSKVKAEKALPNDHKLGMRVPVGGSMCANCRYLSSPTTCGNKGFIEWNGGKELPQKANEYCCDNYQGRKYH